MEPVTGDPYATIPQHKPDLTLGWIALAWMSKYIRQPDGPSAGEKFVFTREQVMFVLWYYAVDQTGRFIYTNAVLRRPKGWGKSPFIAAIALFEFLGPCRFDYFDDDGNPVGKQVPMPDVPICGFSKDQTENTMSMVRAMLAESDAVEDYGLDVGVTRILYGQSKLYPITASAATAEGARPTFAVMDEPHHWKHSNGGHEMYAVIKRNLGKSRDGQARSIATTNAHFAGEESVAESLYDAYENQKAQRTRNQSMLYDSREAPSDTDLTDEASLLAGLKIAYGDSIWVDLVRIIEEINDTTTSVSESRRFYLNQITASIDAWITKAEWDKCVDKTIVIDPDDEIALGFDGSKSEDSTALVGCRISDGHLFLIGAWEKPSGPEGKNWIVPYGEVDARVRNTFSVYNVKAFFADLREWEAYVEQWNNDLSDDLVVESNKDNKIAWDMRGKTYVFPKHAEAFVNNVVNEQMTHDGSTVLTQHVLNARRSETSHGMSLKKQSRNSPFKIDAAVAGVIARIARNAYLALPENKRNKKKKKTNSAHFF